MSQSNIEFEIDFMKQVFQALDIVQKSEGTKDEQPLSDVRQVSLGLQHVQAVVKHSLDYLNQIFLRRQKQQEQRLSAVSGQTQQAQQDQQSQQSDTNTNTHMTSKEVELLLNVMEDALPESVDEWNKVAKEFNQQNKIYRNVDKLRSKFDRALTGKKIINEEQVIRIRKLMDAKNGVNDSSNQ